MTVRRKGFIAILTAMMLLADISPMEVRATSTQDKLNQAQEEKKKTEILLNQTQEEKEDFEEVKSGLEGELGKLNSELSQVSSNLEELEARILEKEAEIEQTGKELDEARETEEYQYESMKMRIKFMYESQDFVLLELLFSSADFSDFLNRSEYIQKLSEYDREQLELYRETKAAIAAKEALLMEEKEDLDDLRIRVKAEQSRVSGLVSQTAGSISHYADQISQKEVELLEKERQLREQEETVEQLKKQLAEEMRLKALAAQSVWRDISEVSFADGDRYLLANLIYCEAGNQPYEGQLAVGSVVMNRVLSGVFPDTVVGVIYQNKQFSPVGSGRLALALGENRATAACYKAADEAMTGMSNVGDCLFFRTPIEGLSGRQIGDHIFY